MKILLALSLTLLATFFFAGPARASNSPNLQLQIFPLECSIDTVDLGNVTSLGLTPENCLPQPPQPPGEPTPQTPPRSTASPQFFPRGTSPTFQFPISNGNISGGISLPGVNRPLIVDSRQVEETRKDQGRSIITVGATILIAAGFLAAIHAVYTGILAPLAANGTIPKPRFPWSKK